MYKYFGASRVATIVRGRNFEMHKLWYGYWDGGWPWWLVSRVPLLLNASVFRAQDGRLEYLRNVEIALKWLGIIWQIEKRCLKNWEIAWALLQAPGVTYFEIWVSDLVVGGDYDWGKASGSRLWQTEII